ncbi:hypothetical protein V1517DRAFT_308124 [Lipomyces orientalis]|uniref:Uncharacterized protein n=1 Tax=Lipomyces orientalis TaxID=1233043 RepID=A0ACC3TQB8_9ASCO
MSNCPSTAIASVLPWAVWLGLVHPRKVLELPRIYSTPEDNFCPPATSSELSTPGKSKFMSHSPTLTVDTSPLSESSTLSSHDYCALVQCLLAQLPNPSGTTPIGKHIAEQQSYPAIVGEDAVSQFECDDDSVDFNLCYSGDEPTAPPPPEYLQRQLEAEGDLDLEDEFRNIVDLIEGTSKSTATVVMETVKNAWMGSEAPSEDLTVWHESQPKLDPWSSFIENSSVRSKPVASRVGRSHGQSSERDTRRVGGGRSAPKLARSFLRARRQSIVPYDVVTSSIQTHLASGKFRPHANATVTRARKTHRNAARSFSHSSLVPFGNGSIDLRVSMNANAWLNGVDASDQVQCSDRQSHTPQFLSRPRQVQVYVPSITFAAPVAGMPGHAFVGLDSAGDRDVEMIDSDFCDVLVGDDIDIMDIDTVMPPRRSLENDSKAYSMRYDEDTVIMDA